VSADDETSRGQATDHVTSERQLSGKIDDRPGEVFDVLSIRPYEPRIDEKSGVDPELFQSGRQVAMALPEPIIEGERDHRLINHVFLRDELRRGFNIHKTSLLSQTTQKITDFSILDLGGTHMVTGQNVNPVGDLGAPAARREHARAQQPSLRVCDLSKRVLVEEIKVRFIRINAFLRINRCDSQRPPGQEPGHHIEEDP
jgi:hypothetical protein